MVTPELDLARIANELNDFLRLKLGDEVALRGEVTRLTGGYDTDTFAFDISNAPENIPNELVLRLYRGMGDSDRVIQESTVQNAAHHGGHPVPLVPVNSEGHHLINRPFIVMERLRGSALGEQLDDPAVLKSLPGTLAGLQADFHSLDSTGLRRRLAESGINVERMSPNNMLGRITQMTELVGSDDLVALNKWLLDRQPAEPTNPAICHGDLHPNNILYENGEVTGLIDWGNVMFTHPEYDVAVTRLIISIGPIEDSTIPPQELKEMLDWAVAEYMAAYRSHRDIDDDLLDYYTTLRAGHAYAKVIANRNGVDLPYTAHDAYAWAMPVLFTAIKKSIEKTTGIALEAI